MRVNRPDLAILDDRAGNAPTVALLAQTPQHVGDRLLVGMRQKIGHAFPLGGIHAHVQRRIGHEAEAAFGLVQLRRRHAQIQQDAIQAGGSLVPLGQAGKIGMPDADPRIVGKFCLRHRDRLRIAIHQQQAAVRTQSRQHGARVTAATERAIQIGSTCLHGEPLHRLVQHYRDVLQ